MALCLHGGYAPSGPIWTPLGAPASLRRNIAGLQAGNGLLEALQMLSVSGIVGVMAEAGIGDLPLQCCEMLIIRFAIVGEIERSFLHLAMQRL